MKELKFPISKSQTYLLKTIIGDDNTSIENYNKWVDSVNFVNYIDGESYALIPALYKRLSSLGFNDININRYKGIYRKAFYKNSLLLHMLKAIGSELNANKIPFTVLKGIPLIINYLDDIGVRSMGDVDMVVDKKDIPKTIKVLNNLGFYSDCGYDIYENLDTRHSYSFSNEKDLEIDLYWIPLPVSYKHIKLDNPVAITYKSISMNILAPEDFIFQACLHGASWDPTVSIRWIFDLQTILTIEKEIDWNHFISKTDETRLPYIFYLQFKCFNELSSIKIPEWVLDSLCEKGNTQLSKRHAKNKLIRPKTLLGRLNWYGYNYQFRENNVIYRLRHYPKHKLMMSRYDRYRDLLSAYIKKYILKKNTKSN